MTTPIQTIEKEGRRLYLVEFYFREKYEAERFELPEKYKNMGMKFVERGRPLDTMMPLTDGAHIIQEANKNAFHSKKVFVSILRPPEIGQYYRIAQL